MSTFKIQFEQQIFSEAHLSELNIMFSKNEPGNQNIIDKCFMCIYGITFNNFLEKYNKNKSNTTVINDIESLIKDKNKLIEELQDDIKHIREKYWDMHQKVIKYEFDNVVYKSKSTY